MKLCQVIKLVLGKKLKDANTPTLSSLYARNEAYRTTLTKTKGVRFIPLYKSFHGPTKRSGDDIA